MPKIFSKSVLLQPRIPSLFVVGLLVAHYLIFSSGKAPEPICNLKMNRPHYSTYLNEFKNINAIKLSITSKCDTPQNYTELTLTIKRLEKQHKVTTSKLELKRKHSNTNFPNVAKFEDFYVLCQKGFKYSYRGEAKGYVSLKDGRIVKVQGNSGKYLAVACLVVTK
jgi:hypothetical protein